jgi:hypothetical protein
MNKSIMNGARTQRGMIMNNADCKHDKVYNMSMILTTYPPQRMWICRKCGVTGTEFIGTIEQNDFDETWARFHKQESEE